MWTAVSGLLAHGDKMNVVGNNIANVSTIGFKSQRMDFNDYLYVDRGSTSGPTQIGEGVSIYAVLGDFSQGAFESTNSGTDIAIDGNGFFGVRQPNSKTLYYTRAGDFYFNKDRELVNPEGFNVQGLRVDNKKQIVFYTGAAVRATQDESPWVGQGTPTDIVLDSWNIVPQRTTNVSVNNLLINDDTYDKTVDYTNPMSALFKLWDAANTQKVPPDPALPEQAYAAQSSVKVYDESGAEHDLTIYFDKVNTPVYDNATPANLVYEVQGLPAGYQMYEYMVTIPPSEDLRSYGGTYDPATNTVIGGTAFYDPSGVNTAQKAGVLMTGVLIFDGGGKLVNQTAYTYGAQGDSKTTYTTTATGTSGNSFSIVSDAQPAVTTGPTATSNGTGVPTVTFSPAPPVSGGTVTVTVNPNTGTAGSSITTTVTTIQNATVTSLGGGNPPAAPVTTMTTTPATQPAVNAQMAGDPDDMAMWQPTRFSSNGLPVFTANFTGQPLANSVSEMMQGTGGPPPFSQAQEYIVELDFGLSNAGGSWNNVGTSLASLAVVPGTPSVTTVDVGGISYTVDSTSPPAAGSYTPVATNTPGNYADIYYDGTNVVIASWTEGTGGAITNLVSYSIPATQVTSTAPAILPSVSNPQASTAPASTTLGTKPNIPYSTSVATMERAERDEDATANNGTEFISDAQQDGYASGVLNGYNIDTNGVLYGRYSNNVTLPLWQMTLYDFRNLQGLRREGGNLYSQTMESGNARWSIPGNAGFGSTQAYNIEQSNVDMAREFVQMISTQRGFQANSKSVSTVDTMLETVIGMKR
jgi:flagellar hook protein FlgE